MRFRPDRLTSYNNFPPEANQNLISTSQQYLYCTILKYWKFSLPILTNMHMVAIYDYSSSLVVQQFSTSNRYFTQILLLPLIFVVQLLDLYWVTSVLLLDAEGRLRKGVDAAKDEGKSF